MESFAIQIMVIVFLICCVLLVSESAKNDNDDTQDLHI